MITYYNIFSTDNNTIILDELDTVELAALIVKNPDTSKYRIEPVSVTRERKVKPPKSDKELAALKVTFMRTLSIGQKNDIRTMKKEIKYNDRIGYYLQAKAVVNGQENGQRRVLEEQGAENKLYTNLEQQFFSPELAKSHLTSEIGKGLRASLLNWKYEIYREVFYSLKENGEFSNLSEQDFEVEADKIFDITILPTLVKLNKK